MKPDWHKGDLICMPQDLAGDGYISHGCHVFEAEHDPHQEEGGRRRWLYGARDCREIRRATVEDVDRLIECRSHAVVRESHELGLLLELRAKFFGKMGSRARQ